MKFVRSSPSSLPVLLLLVACSGPSETTDRCFVNLAPITARTNRVSVSDTVAFHATLGPAACLPAGITTEDWRWSSTDTLIARIDSLSGLAQGVSPGDVTIEVHHAQDPHVASGAGLQVVNAESVAVGQRRDGP
jgi:uncharacterized protein YjdB